MVVAGSPVLPEIQSLSYSNKYVLHPSDTVRCQQKHTNNLDDLSYIYPLVSHPPHIQEGAGGGGATVMNVA